MLRAAWKRCVLTCLNVEKVGESRAMLSVEFQIVDADTESKRAKNKLRA